MAAEVKGGGEPRGGEGPRLMKAAGLISVMTMLSRVLGLVREQVVAALLGAGFYADAFQVAFRIPNLLRDLFAEGALSAAFVPTYARVLKEGGDERANQLASRVFTMLLVVLGGIVVLGVVFAGPLVSTLASGFEHVTGPGGADKTAVTVRLTRVMLPFLPLVSFAAVAMGMLNARHRFTTPAAAPALFNLVTIVWAGGLWLLGFGPAQVAFGWAVGTVLGGAAQFLIQVPPLRKDGFRFRFDWALHDPALRDIVRLMGPATVGLAAVQVNIFVGTSFASTEQGAVAWLQYAFRVLYLPIGIFGVAAGTVATAGLARRVAEGDQDGVRDTLVHSLRNLTFLTLPATVGLLVLAVPIVRLLFERGRFLPSDTYHTAMALILYATGLVFYTSVKVLAPAFYAFNAPRVPLLASFAAVATNLVVILLLHPRLGFSAIALGTALGSMVNGVVLVAVLERRLGRLTEHGLVWALGKMTLAATLMVPVCLGTLRATESWLGTRGLPAQMATGLLPIAAGGAAYVLAAWALRIPEVRVLGSLLRGR